MSKDAKEKEKLKVPIKEILTNFNTLLLNINSKTNDEIHLKLWQIRADLELICIKVKEIINKENTILLLQKEISSSIKGTVKREKAIVLLSKFQKNINLLNEKDIEDENTIFKNIWHLKETISAVLKAFPQRKFIWLDGEYIEEDDKDIFVI